MLAHEMGHFIAGHLDDANSFVPAAFNNDLLEFDEGRDHEKEFEADQLAVALMSKAAANDGTGRKQVLLVSSLASVFELMRLLGGDRHTHPDPRERLANASKGLATDARAILDLYSQLPR